MWEHIGKLSREGAGTVRMPLAADGSPGVDLLSMLPETRAWLEHVARAEELVLGMHAYADGGDHVRATGAFDALATDVLQRRPSAALAFLATPTDAFVVPEQVVARSHAAYSERRVRRILQAPAKGLSGKRLFAAAYGDGVPVADALVKQQGPNYAIAKRLQRWRGIVTNADGGRVSFNVAPPTWTRSVTKNRLLAAAYAGARHFGVEIFEPSTTRVLMAAMLGARPPPAALTARGPGVAFQRSGRARRSLERRLRTTLGARHRRPGGPAAHVVRGRARARLIRAGRYPAIACSPARVGRARPARVTDCAATCTSGG